MKLIPIYDATAPIACTASGNEIERRIRQLERMRRDLARVERTDHGLLLHFPYRSELEGHLRTFTIEEKGCCAFWGFATSTDNGELTLRWDGPPDVTDFFQELATWFEGDEPLTADSGLL